MVTSVRTCIGCRERAERTTLVRLVVVADAGQLLVVADAGRGLPGRGAHLHRDRNCLELARRRKAFARAFRVTGPVDTHGLDAMVEYV